MSKVFVLAMNKQPLDPCHPGQARRLLKAGQAAVYKLYPFTIILSKEITEPETAEYQLKFDPGSKKTGIAIVNQETGEVVFATELEHRGSYIKARLAARRAVRRNRRARKTRYRAARFNNRTKPEGWLAPSLMSRVYNIETWAKRLIKLCPIKGISMELVKFDTQLMNNPEISGVQYQQGTLAGYEVREYLLEKFEHRCAYCNKTGIPLQIEHIIPKSRQGTNTIANLTLACQPCNLKKGNKTAMEFGFPEVQAQTTKSLKDTSAVNSVRWTTLNKLKYLGLPVETGSGGLTKFNRTTQQLPKTHWLDAACVGTSTPTKLIAAKTKVREIKATGHGKRQMCRVNKFGFPRTKAKAGQKAFGFQTGDMVKAIVTTGKNAGTHIGKVAIRLRGYFNITKAKSIIKDISYKCCKLLFHCDGYAYA